MKAALVTAKALKQVEIKKSPTQIPSLKFTVGNKRSWIPVGLYEAKINKIEKKCTFKDKPSLEFIFEITSGEYKGVELRGFCNINYQTFSENTKLYQWYAVATGDELAPGDELDLADFYDKVFQVEVEEKISKKTKNKFSNVVKILRVICEL